MVDVFSGIAGLNAIMDTLKRFKDIGDANVRNTISVELSEKILAAYQAQLALTEQVGNLEKEVAAFKNWEAEKERYILTDYGSGTFAYALKPAMAKGEPPHRLCTNCYDQAQKSILQLISKGNGQEYVRCPRCKSKVFLGTYTNQDYRPEPPISDF